MNAEGQGTNADIIAGLERIVDDAKQTKPQAAACNMSIGGQRSRALDAAMNNVFKANISCSVAAGNENACHSKWPSLPLSSR